MMTTNPRTGQNDLHSPKYLGNADSLAPASRIARANHKQEREREPSSDQTKKDLEKSKSYFNFIKVHR